MKKLLFCLCLTALSGGASAQANGVTLNLDDQNPLSKWGRWTYFDYQEKGLGFNLSQNRNRIPLSVNWRSGDWVFQLNKDAAADRHDLFFGIRLTEDQLATTSLGCMSNHRKGGGYKGPMCGVQLDVNLK